jgi:alkylated DNA nucleotide flippase Atl1
MNYICGMAKTPNKFTTKKPWAEKMQHPAEPVIEVLNEQKGPAYPAGRMLIGTPMAIDEIVKGIPKGDLMTAGKLRAIMADKFDADYACPMTTGIFLRIAAEYANEQMNKGVKNVTPFWRVIRDDGSLIDKLPGGIEHQAELLAKEGFTFIPKGKNNVRVKAFENYI